MATPPRTHTQAPVGKRTVAAPALAAYRAARQEALARFAAQPRIQPLWRALTHATDQLLQQAVSASDLTLVAVGGYGRCELLPFSDVDVLVLVPPHAQSDADHAIIALLQSLWDQRVPIAHATRTVEETIAHARADATISAALMDARFIAGDRKRYRALKRALRQQVFGKQTQPFVEAKLAERDARHARYGDSRFMLEPNVKEGKGGLRDLQTLNWLARDAYGVSRVQQLVRDDLLNAREWRQYRQAYLFFSTLRAALHAMRGRADERLTFDAQVQIATQLGFRGKTPEQRAQRLMLRYFQHARTVGNMTRILCALLEEAQLRAPSVRPLKDAPLPEYLMIDHGRIHFSPSADPAQHPHQLVGLFAGAQACGADIHPRAQLLLSRLLPVVGRQLPLDGESNRWLRHLLVGPAPDLALRRMHEMGVLSAIIPEFGPLTGQMQYDGYHTYTVDEHILVALGFLRQFETGALAQQHPLATDLAADGQDRAVLFLAMLCHDIAKGKGGGHADKGAVMAQHIARRVGLEEQDARLVGWLVQHHALLSDAAFKRDLDDEQAIADFVAVVQSPQRLRLLLLITAADIKAVGPTIFNGWKGALMRSLYQRAMHAMGVSDGTHEVAMPQALVARWKTMPDRPAISITHDSFRAVSEITCCAAYQPHLFSAFAGVLTAMGASIVSARFRQLGDDAPGAVLAQWRIQNPHGESFADDARRLNDLTDHVQEALADPKALEQRIAARRVVAPRRGMAVRDSVFIDNRVSHAASVVEVNARDRLGLLYAMLRVMEDCQLQVTNAKLATYGQLAVDVFYVKDAYGHQITHPVKQQQLQQMLLAAVAPDAQDTTP